LVSKSLYFDIYFGQLFQSSCHINHHWSYIIPSCLLWLFFVCLCKFGH